MKSYWKQTKTLNYPILNEDIHCNICIVGAGLHGIVLAYLLKDYDVVLVDQSHFMSGASSMNTGKLTSQHGDCYHKIIKKYGKQVAKDYFLHNQMAIDKVKEWHKEYNFTLTLCDTLLCSKYKQDVLEKEYEAYQILGIPGNLTKHTLSMDNQYQFHPVELANELLKQLHNVRCYQDTQIIRYDNNDTVTLSTPNHTIQANTVIFTNHSPTLFSEYLLFTRYKAYTSYLIMKPYNYTKPFNILNIDNNNLSFRTIEDNNKKYILIAGQDHRFGILEKNHYNLLHEQTTNLSQQILQQWQNHDYTTYDLLPFIGEIKENIYLSFGFNLWGNTWSIAASLLLYNKIIHNIDQISQYHPRRIKDIFTLQCITSNTETMYYLIKYYLFYFYKKNGTIIIYKNKKYGYYHNNNTTILVNIHCPHLGCILQYNPLKQTWDCPCHASSFTYDGTRICGPTTKSLENIIIKK